MRRNLRILVVDDESDPTYLGRMLKDALDVDSVEYFHAATVNEGFDTFCQITAEGILDLMIVDLSLPKSPQEKAGDQRMARSGYEFSRADYVDALGGLKLIGLIAEHIRQKTGDPKKMIDFPTLYLSGWERQDQHREQIKLYHRSLSFDWVEKPIGDTELVDKCVCLLGAYEVCFGRTGLS